MPTHGHEPNKYTCIEYRAEMRLNSLRRRVAAGGLSEREREEIAAEIHRLEDELDMK